jgi:putative oxidoreductase
VASISQHRGRPIWVSEGGAELPVTNIAAMSAIAIAGPGKLSVDALLGTSLPRWWIVPGAMAIGAIAAYMDTVREQSLEIDEDADEADEDAEETQAPKRASSRSRSGSTRKAAA